MSRYHCEQISNIVGTFEKGLRAPLEGINQESLNHVFAKHKMTIGQIAVHCTAWAGYFLADKKPWEVVDWTCRPCEYPLTIKFVDEVINDGISAIYQKLNEIDDEWLDITPTGQKGPGYIICRLLLHMMSHGNQMAYLRQLLDPTWDYGSHFGDMASAFIKLEYSTSRDMKIGGF